MSSDVCSNRKPMAMSVLAVVLVALLAPTGAASADPPNDLNGVYRAVSNGEWAQTNDSYRDQDTVIATWTISTSCRTVADCTGEVSSDQGWTAPIYLQNSSWYVKRAVPGWQVCPDGTASDAEQIFRFYRVGAGGQVDPASPNLAGVDRTAGISGACGKNLVLVVRMPFSLDPIR